MQSIHRSNEKTTLHKSDDLVKEVKSTTNAIEALGNKVDSIIKSITAPKPKAPDVTKVKGEVSILNALTAKISNFPSVFKVQGKVEVDFPKVQEVKGKVDVQFPDVQKVDIDVKDLQKATEALAPLLESLNKKEQATFPIWEGEEPSSKANPTKYIAVRLTNGKMFYEVWSQSVQSNGKVVNALERLITSVDRQNKYDFELDDYTTAEVMYLGEAEAGTPYTTAKWRIQKMNMATGIQAKWAGGSALFDKRWDLRTTYTY